MNAAVLTEAEPPMPKTQNPWSRYALITAALTTVGGGVPYITTLQTKVDDTRERCIRMEEQIKIQTHSIEMIQDTVELLRRRGDAR